MKTPYDVVVIGAGPAGSTAAALLAEKGHKVLLLEREKFPRYHIGESLLPFNFYPLQRLGLDKYLRKSHFVKKYSVQFVSPSGRASHPFNFGTRYAADIAQTWQVLRSEFDQILMDNAKSKGAEVEECFTVKDLMMEDDRVVGVTGVAKDAQPREIHAKMTLDCSGKESFSAAKFNWRRRDPKLNKVAVWTYYKGAKRGPGLEAGATTVAFLPGKGWFWHIPLHDDLLSVGVVAEGKYLARDGVKDPGAMFHREVENNLWIKDSLSAGQSTGEYRITNEYTFRSEYCGRDGLLLMGDAFGFIDPCFSSGVMLALKCGMFGADAVHEALVAGDVTASRFTDYSEKIRQGMENMRKLIYAFYDPNVSFRTVTDQYANAQGDITDCLSGDVNKDFSQLFRQFSEITQIPEELPHGKPFVSSSESLDRPC